MIPPPLFSSLLFATSLLGMSLLALGCTSADPAASPDGASPDGGSPGADASSTSRRLPEGVPCEVGQILADRCLGCHAAPPQFGAPVTLESAEAFTQMSSTGEPLHARAHDRILRSDHTRMPPPSQPPLREDEIALLGAWLEGGAAAVDDRCEDAGPIAPCVGPDCLPCEPTHAFVAEGDGPDGAYPVPTSGNPYACFAFPSPFAPGDQATAWAPIIDDERVVHHWILYRTATEPDLGAGCEMPLDAIGMMGWAPGATNTVLPNDVGLELSTAPGEWLILQMHYWNAAGYRDAADRSGVSVCTTDSPRPNTAAVITVGTTAIGIPPRTSEWTATATCPSTSTFLLRDSLHVLAATPHMHRAGTRISTEILRAGLETSREPLVHVEPFSFDDQRTLWMDEPVIVRPGDALRTSCAYDNPTGDWIFFGERSEDEMCFDFLLVYPIEVWPAGYGRTCLTAIGL